MATFSERLRTLRQKHEYRQKDIADRLGVSESAYGYYEQGRREPSQEALIKLAEIFDVTVDYLLGRTDDPHGYATPSNDGLSLEEQKVLQTLRDLPPDKRQEVADFADFLKYRTAERGRDEQSATIEYDETPFTSLGFPQEYLDEIPLNERPAFIAWVSENLQGVFFYDFDSDPKASVRAVFESLLIMWERHKQQDGRRSRK